MLNFNLNQSGNYIVEFLNFNDSPFINPVISTQTVTSTGVNNTISLTIPDGNYTIPKVKITKVNNSNCVVTKINVGVNCVVKPNCGCGTESISIGQIFQYSNTSYGLNFNGCSLSSASIQVKKAIDNTIVQTITNIAVTSSTINFSITNLPVGEYYFTLIGENCTGQTDSQKFTISNTVPSTNEKIEFRFFTPQHVPNESNLINTLKQAKVKYPNAIFKAPVIFNWRDTLNINSINGTIIGGVNNFTQPLNRVKELLDNNIIPFVIIDCNLTSLNHDSPFLGTATYKLEDEIRRRDGLGEVTSISWSSPRMINVYAYIVQSVTALKNYLTTNYSTFDLNKIYVECPFTQNLENEYPPAQYGNYDNSYDYNPYQIAHFRQWMGNKNASNNNSWDGINKTPTNDNLPNFIGGNETDRINWRLFIANMYYEINKKLSQIIKAVDSRFKYELNSGFFSDNVFNWRRSDLALTGEMNSFVDCFKHNPARDYHQSISNKLVASIREDQQSTVEWTRADGEITEPAFTLEISDKVRKSINDGVRQISLSFYEGNFNQPPLTNLFNNSNPNDTNTVLGNLHSDGTLYRNYTKLSNSNIVSRNIDSNYLLGAGFINDANLKIVLSAAIAANGTENVKLKINWNLGNYKYLSLNSTSTSPVEIKVETRTANINIQKINNYYKDITPSTIDNYIAYYFINNLPLEGLNGERLLFDNIILPSNSIITVSKVFVNPSVFTNWNSIKDSIYLAAYIGGNTNAIYSYEQHIFKTT